MRARPLVHLEVSRPPTDVLQAFDGALRDDACICLGHVGKRELSLTVCEKNRHTWSPYVSLEVRRTAEGGSSVRGRFGPAPHLWTLFVLVYALLVAVFLSGTMYGFVQVSLGMGYEGLYVALGACCGLAVACSVDLAGRRVSARQMDHIRTFIHEVLPEAQDLDPDHAAQPPSPTAPAST